VHWFDADLPSNLPETVPDDKHGSDVRDHRIDLHGHESVQAADAVKTRQFPDHYRQTVHDKYFGDLKPFRSPARSPSNNDVEAEDYYAYVLHELRTTTRLY
jgi:hypothetical protein